MIDTSATPTGAGQPRPSHNRERLFRIITIALITAVVAGAAVAAELAMRYRERHRTTPPDYVPSIYYPHRRLRYGLIPNLDYYGWFRINSLGFRGKEVSRTKPAGMFRIVCLGGSTTFDIATLGSAAPWPDVMESELKRRLGTNSLQVLNLGIPGATSLDSLIDLQIRALELQPDLVIVYQAHNDFIYSIPGARTRPSGLFPDEDPPRSRLERWLTIHSLLYAKTEARLFGLVDGVTGLFGGPGGETTPEARTQAIAKGLADFERNVRSIAAITRANHVPLVLPEVVVPFPPAGSPADACHVCAGLTEAYAGLPIATIRATLDGYNAVLRDLGGQDQGVYTIDTAGFVPAADRYYHDPVHFGPEGSNAMGTRLAAALAPVMGHLTSPEAPATSASRE